MAYLFIAKILPLCLVLSLFLFALRKISTSASDFLADRMGLHFWATAALCMMMVYAAALAFRLYLPATLDFVEATVASTSSLFLHGHPLYAGLQDADRYSLMYGPLCFLPYSIFFMFGAGSIGTLLVALAFWNVALFASLWLLYRTFLSKAESLVAVAAIASALMMKSSYIFMIRGDVILACCVALSLLACSRFNRMAAVCLFSVAGACAIDVKITAVFYLLVPAYFLVRRHGVRAMAACMAFIPCVALLPCMLPGISLRHYVLWLYEASRHPLSRTVLIMNLLPALLVTLGPLLMYWRLALADHAAARLLFRKHRGLIALFALSVLGTLITGGKIGAGRYHFNATFIVSTYMAARLWRMVGEAPVAVNRRFAQIFAVYVLFLVLPACSEMLDMRALCVPRRAFAEAVNADIDSILSEHANQTVEMGYGENLPGTGPIDELTSFRTRLVFAGNPLTVDVSALFDMQLSGVQVPRATSDAIASCRTAVWLIPHGPPSLGHAFSTLNPYAIVVPSRFPDQHFFPEAFRAAFLAHYRKTGKSRFYDVWSCSSRR